MTKSIAESAEEIARRFNYWDPALNENPHAVLKQLRSQCPVAHSDELGGYWLITGYDEMRRVLADPASFSSRVLTLPPEGSPPLLVPETIDPPEHAKYRRVFTPYFTPRRAEALRERTRGIAIDLIERFVANGGGDFVADVAVPLPCTVFLDIAGLPVSDLEQLLDWKERFMRDGVSDDPEKRQYVAEHVMPALMGYFNKALDDRQAMGDERPDDLLTGLLTGELSEGVTMTRDEILNALLLLLAAGLDTVTAAIGMSMEYLARNPMVRREITADPALIPVATEEFLRYFSLVTNARQANSAARVGDVDIEAGDYVVVCGPSANRDERQFTGGEEVDIRRSPNPHLAFGAGPHRCLGSHLARMEMAVAFEEIHRLMPEYYITDGTSPQHRFGGVMGISELNLTVGSPAS